MKISLRKGRKFCIEDEGTKIVRNCRWNISVRGKGGTTPCWSRYPHCSPMEDPMLQQLHMSWEKWQHMESPHWIRGKGWGERSCRAELSRLQTPVPHCLCNTGQGGEKTRSQDGGTMLNLGKRRLDKVSFCFSMSTYFSIGNKLN